MTIQVILIIGCVVCSVIAFIIGSMWRVIADKKYKEKDHQGNAGRKPTGSCGRRRRRRSFRRKPRFWKQKTNGSRLNRNSKKTPQKRGKHTRGATETQGTRSIELKRRDDTISKRETEFTARESFLNSKEKTLRNKDNELTKLVAMENEKLEKISHMTQDEAKKILMTNLEGQVRYEAAQMIKEIKDTAKAEAENEAKEILVQAIQRCAADATVESTVIVVHLPSDEMKGRIIGREGRNIRSFEEATGIDVIVDDTPEAVILSGFDPIKREIARMALEKLISDGRIHPGRIEELIKKSEKEIEKKMKEAAEEVIFELDVHGLKPKLVEMIGRLKYRTSYGQNVLQHCKEVAMLAGLMASELGLDPKIAIRAGLLHDIGKAIDRETEGTHSQLGADLAAKNGENDIIATPLRRTTRTLRRSPSIPILIQAADTISSTRPGVRRETLTNYVNRLTKLEEIADSFRGVSKTYVIQAGREIRCIVEPEQISDAQSEELARQIATKIQDDMEYPGQIKVTIIRETRFTEYAK